MRATVTLLCALAILFNGCSGEQKGGSTPMQVGFSWVIDEKLAGLPRPGTGGALDNDLDYLNRQRIDLLVTLTETPLDAAALQRHDLTPLHLPVEDFHAPKLEQIVEFVDRVDAVIAAGGRVGVHCAAGKGRTGTFLAAYFVHLGDEPQAAIDRVRELRPGSIETEDQEKLIARYHARGG